MLVGALIRQVAEEEIGFKVGQNWYGVLYQTLARPDLNIFFGSGRGKGVASRLFTFHLLALC